MHPDWLSQGTSLNVRPERGLDFNRFNTEVQLIPSNFNNLPFSDRSDTYSLWRLAHLGAPSTQPSEHTLAFWGCGLNLVLLETNGQANRPHSCGR